MRSWTRSIAAAAAACALCALPALALPVETPPAHPSPPAGHAAPHKPAGKPNKERTAKPKAREHANFKKAKACGAASRACLAKCHGIAAPAAHTQCVNHGKCDTAYAHCMGKTL